jgi:hypothetical protein
MSIEKAQNNPIKLSIIAARYIWPVYSDPIQEARDSLANVILQKMIKKNGR